MSHGDGQPARCSSAIDQLKLGGVLGLATAAAAVPFTEARSAPAPTRRIAIVGGGLAGLTCAYELKQAGQLATVYEASSRVGGRSSTQRGAFADGQLVERGGQLIDQGHTAIRQLASRLGLQTDNLLQAEAKGSEPLYHFGSGCRGDATRQVSPADAVLTRFG
jgi:monoamine oxidase